ncbi:MAG: hypothetical protein WB729_15130 [Candidatus Sulfotelmatobacter sp.]
MLIGYCIRNGVEQTNEDLKNPERENEPGSSILQKIPPASRSRNISLPILPANHTAQYFFLPLAREAFAGQIRNAI